MPGLEIADGLPLSFRHFMTAKPERPNLMVCVQAAGV